jgi:hypothetical protein
MPNNYLSNNWDTLCKRSYSALEKQPCRLPELRCEANERLSTKKPSIRRALVFLK